MQICQASTDLKHAIHGRVRGCFYNPKTGEQCGHFRQDNVTTYVAADIMARMLGGDNSYVPGYMGFIYGALANPGAALIEPPVSRTQDWGNLSSELADPGVTGNVLITPLAAGPSYAIDGSATHYSGNEVMLTANTGSRLEYGFPVAPPYAYDLADGNYLYHVMLITRLVAGRTITYLPFARVTLLNSSYPQKPVGLELSIFWKISYY